MTEEAGREHYEKIRGELAAEYPAVLGFDLDQPGVRTALAVKYAIQNGFDFVVSVERPDGSIEDLTFTNFGVDADGIPQLDVKSSSADGVMSPESAEWATAFLLSGQRAEINQMLGPQ